MLVKYNGSRSVKKVCWGRKRYIFTRENDRTCEITNPMHLKRFMGEDGLGQYTIIEQVEKKREPTEVAVEEYICKTCKKLFKSYAGLKAHQSKSHKPVKGKSKAKPKKKKK